jgi:uncharacterized protein (DUF2236 family)
VAQGVQDHSEFKKNPFKRLQGTLEAVAGVVFGSRALGDGIGRRVRWVHEFVVGAGYTALEPSNLLWVHATLCDTALRCYEDLVEPLSTSDRETFYVEMMEVAEVFGCPRGAQPATYAEFASYFDETVASMAVSDVGRDLSQFILDPTLPLRLDVPMKPLLRLQRLYTLGSLPPRLRAELGFSWSAVDEARYERVRARVRRVMRATPRSVRTAGTRLNNVYLLWLAERHVRQFDEKQALRAVA